MARPIKNNADYFSHDADMRNDIRIKALRRKFQLEGYSIYCMMLEVLTDSENFKADFTPMGIELLSGDFDCTPEFLNEVITYCCHLGLFQINPKTGIIACETLENRFSGLLSKRKRDRNEVIADDNTQSKVKESKVKEITHELLSNTISLLKREKNPNTMEVRAMLQQWTANGHTDIIEQLTAMQAHYRKNGLVFPTRIETLTRSFEEANWIEKLKEQNPETIDNGLRKPEPDIIGTSAPGSLG